ncbi:scavenger receptor cysteine-rich type 1 protein M160-like [Sinocyclocheilus rhinocerous]|uniref:scavenger receptor cysteine-rich type 1 protein M160-like n=1 Tax=Sinocyclocheilus rhinocerous TaxID=307959 RepID=UPI0007B98059|nr:PREDICTED: scavenger receptor cysteine-rich type 1 protein M160-like [Sinocyclocheilus rhinocerous]
MWFLLLYFQISAIQGLSVTLRGSDSPCKGRLEVYNGHGGNKQWGLVCHYGWIKENGEVVCKSIGCGNHMHSDVERTRYKDPPLPQQYWMDEVKCTSKEESLWKCLYVDINEKEKCDESSFVAVECSGKVTLSLNLNGQRDKCAGVVEFSTPNGIFGVCNDKWDESKANKICQELGCGDHHYIPKLGMFKGQQSKPNVLLNCVGNEQYSWQCMERSDCQERASVICSNHTRFRLQDGSDVCSGLVEEKTVKQNSWNPLQQTNVRPEVICTLLNCGSTGNFTSANGTNRLTCSDSVKLHNFTTECFGDVSIDVNGANYEVCYSDQPRENMGAVVCRELGCGDIVLVKQGSVTSNGLLSNVECQGDEQSLWHCLANHEKKRCTGTKVICSGSLDVRLSDGLGDCSGRVEVKWEGSWRPIGSDRTTMNSDVVCQHLNCGTSIQINRELFIEGEKEPPEWLWNVKCRNSSVKLHECFDNTNLRLPRQNEKNIEIICKKEELKFFEGNSPCEGKVCIEQFDGSKSVEPRVALQNPLGEKCWGMVKVCGDVKCGGVCSSTWRTNEDSKMICGNLGCGNPIQAQLPLQINNRPATYHNWERLLLYNKEGECSGPVYGLRDGNTQQVSGLGWGREEGQKLCEYLQCGNYISHSTIIKNTNEWWKKTYNCSGKNNIWECESNDQPIQNQQQLNIQCERKSPNIMLSNNCTGEVLIDKEHVCASQWDYGMSDKLCDNLNCGKAIHSWATVSAKKNRWHFSCTGKETLLWQCGFKNDSCKNILSVACKDSVEFGTTEKCGGKLGIRYKGQWEYVCGKLTEADTKKVCDVLKCNDSGELLLDEQKIANEIKVKIDCPKNHYKIFQCMHHLKKDKCSHGPAEIICEGYTPKDNSSVGLILGLLGGVLGLLILFLMWANRKRLLLALRYYRKNNGKDVNPDVNEMDKMDREDRDLSEGKASFLDNDDYEDVDSVMDKSGEEDEYDRKTGSSGTEYDDIEGQANGISPSQTHHDDDLNLPLLPKRPENILDQDTYEVEIEKQEDYDDVIPVEAAANENAGTTGTQAHVDVDVDEGADSDSDAGLVANADAVLVTTEVEVHAQAE